LKGNWSKYGTIGQKIHKISLWNVQHRLLWTGKKRIKTKWSGTFFSGSKKNSWTTFPSSWNNKFWNDFKCNSVVCGGLLNKKLVVFNWNEELSTETRKQLV
jgi:hypothetical protein